MEPPFICYTTLLTSLINIFVDIFGEKQYLTTNYFIFLKKKRGWGKNAPKKPLTLPLKVASPSHINQYILEQYCTKFGAFITMWTILPKYDSNLLE